MGLERSIRQTMKETDAMIDLSRFDRSTFTNVPHEQIVKKPWGREVILTPPGLPYTGKVLHINAGYRLSLQVHDKKIETVTLVSGKADLLIDDKDGEIQQVQMDPFKGYTIQPGQKHRVEALTDAMIFEVSTAEKGTTYRLEDDYSRGDETEAIRKKERNIM